MTLKNTIRSLSFVLVASASSVVLAQSLGTGLGATARVGAGGAQVGSEAQAGTDLQIGTQRAAPGAAVDSATQTTGSAGRTADGTGASIAADAGTDAHAKHKKSGKAKQVKPVTGNAAAQTDVHGNN